MGECSYGLLLLVAATAVFERRRNKLLDACVLDPAASNTGAPLVYIGVPSVCSLPIFPLDAAPDRGVHFG